MRTETPHAAVIPSGDLHTIEIDPIANDNPMMLPSEFNLLVNDIKANRQKDPVLMYDGKIMDGRNRLAAAKQLNIDLKVIHLTGTREEAEASTRSSDARRNLSKSQIAMKLALRVVASRVNIDGTHAPKSQWLSPKKLIEVKNKLIGERSVEFAVHCIKEYPDIANSVFEGHFDLGKAKNIIAKFKIEQETAQQKLQAILDKQAHYAANYAPEALYIDEFELKIAEKYSSGAVEAYKSYLFNEGLFPRQKLAGLLVTAEQELQQYNNPIMKQTARMRSELD